MTTTLGNPITSRQSLWQGPIPPKGDRVGRSFDVLVLCAAEYQPARQLFPGVEVLYAPLRDTIPTPEEIVTWRRTAAAVAERLGRGKRVLVTCAAGLNRSGIVSAGALMLLGHAPGAATRGVRRARGTRALGNTYFVALLHSHRALMCLVPSTRREAARPGAAALIVGNSADLEIPSD